MENLENSSNIKDVSNIEKKIHLNSSTPIQNTSTSKKIDRFKIIKNMEEVLKSIKKHEHKKHERKKHKHKHNKKNCSKSLNNLNINEIADISNKMDSTSSNLTKTKNYNSASADKLKTLSKENRLEMKRKRKKKLINDQQTETNNTNKHTTAISTMISDSFISPKKLITGHFSITPKKQAHTETIEIKLDSNKNNDLKVGASGVDQNCSLESNKDIQNVDSLNTSKMNAFEFLMNSRNKSIGRNSPGKEFIDDDISYDPIEKQKKIDRIKRKILLQDLAETKGGSKRKLEDEARGDYIELQLNKRAKRLKTMLTDPKKTLICSSPEITETTNDKPAIQSKTAKKRSKRSSTIHISSIEFVKENILNEDATFVAKLSSPIKKRDNLLGYFSKTSSPITANNEISLCATPEISIENKTPRRRGRPRRIEGLTLNNNSNNLSSKSEAPEAIEIVENTSTSIHRSRRSCATKPKYDYDLEESPTKSKKKNKKKNDIENGEKNVIDLDEIQSKKLAPLFIKNMPKPTVDPEIQKARQEFLMSGIPDKMKKELAKQKIYEENFESSINIFPLISHVPAWQIDNIKLLNEYSYKMKCLEMENNKCNIFIDDNTKNSTSNKIKTLICVNSLNKSKLLPLKLVAKFDNKKHVVKAWKNLYDKFPTYKCFNQLRQKYHFFSSSDTGEDCQQITESFMVTSRSNRKSSAPEINDDDIQPPPSAPNGELLYTEKYKALSSDQILVNLSPVNDLKEFLSGWQNINNMNKDDSFNDFEDSTSCSVPSSNTIVLVGPKSSGKTSSVFALANEMNFQILEINAGMKRTGKKLLQDLQEATQSHQVRKDSNLIKKTLENTKLKKKTLNQNIDSLFDFTSEKMSLILLEDADILFEQHDCGFVDAIYQLTATSKRPVVITANNLNCQHLNRLINNNSIYFSAPDPVKISKFISIIALIENCPIALNDILSLYLFNSMDLRKTILEMQFFIQSGGDRYIMEKNNAKINSFFAASLKNEKTFSLETDNLEYSIEKYIHAGLFDFYINSQNLQNIIPIPINYNILWKNLHNIFFVSKNLKDVVSSQCAKSTKPYSNKVLDNMVDFYENISIANYLDKPTEHNDRLKSNIGEEISYYLVENSLKENLNAENFSINLYEELQEETMVLTTSISSTGLINKNKPVALDYEPYLRSICRSEKGRLLHERRTTRFYHYLRNFQTNFISTNVYDDSCNIFVDN